LAEEDGQVKTDGMKALVESTAFRKDLKRVKKRGCDREKLDALIRKLQSAETLPASSRPHPLKGEWKGFWECHVEPDWLLIYAATDTELHLARTGTHADLFAR
jgi:mRNA interferase YafQ